jgi:hypothetical protein
VKSEIRDRRWAGFCLGSVRYNDKLCPGRPKASGSDKMLCLTKIKTRAGWLPLILLLVVSARGGLFFIFSLDVGNELVLPDTTVLATIITVVLATEVLKRSRRAMRLLIVYSILEAVIVASGPLLLPLIIALAAVGELPPKAYLMKMLSVPHTLQLYLIGQMLFVTVLLLLRGSVVRAPATGSAS